MAPGVHYYLCPPFSIWSAGSRAEIPEWSKAILTYYAE